MWHGCFAASAFYFVVSEAVLRGASPLRLQLPGYAGPVWGGHSFEDSPAAANPWAPTVHDVGLGDLEPTAPFDSVSRPSRAYDYVDPYAHPDSNPLDEGLPNIDDQHVYVPLEDRTVVIAPDKLRPLYGSLRLDPGDNYPLVAPTNRMDPGPEAISQQDQLPHHVAKYLHQAQMRNAGMSYERELGKDFEAMDTNQDSELSYEEFKSEMDFQRKTQEEAQTLWRKYHVSKQPGMTRKEFLRMAQEGFDLGPLHAARNVSSGENASRVTKVLTVDGAADRGFWGGGVVCPKGQRIVGAQLKVEPTGADADGTALNSVRFQCEDGTTITTVEGEEGQWTAWARCPSGQVVYGFYARNKVLDGVSDSTGVNDLGFLCKSKDLQQMTRLRFGSMVPTQGMVVGAGTVAVSGGWTPETACEPTEAICGAQARLDSDGQGDYMGLTNIRLFCCAKMPKCFEVCNSAPGAETSDPCQACKLAKSLAS